MSVKSTFYIILSCPFDITRNLGISTCLAWQIQWMSLLYGMSNKELKQQGFVQALLAPTCVLVVIYMPLDV